MFLQDQVTFRAICPPCCVTSSLPDTLSLPTDPGLYFKRGGVQKEAPSEGRKCPDQCAKVQLASLNFLGRGRERGVLIPWECYSVTWVGFRNQHSFLEMLWSGGDKPQSWNRVQCGKILSSSPGSV